MNLKWKVAQAAEIKWWNNYLKHKDKSSYYDWKRRYWVDFLKDINFVLSPTPLKILDAGSGPAGIFTILKNHEVVAVDPLLDKYESSLEQFETSDFQNVEFITSTIERIHMDQRFDIVFCLNCINHVSSIQSSLRNLFNALKPGGKIVLSTDAHNSNLLKNLFQLIPGDILHPHQYNIEEYKAFVNNAGFQVSSMKMVKSENIFGYWVIQAYRPH